MGRRSFPLAGLALAASVLATTATASDLSSPTHSPTGARPAAQARATAVPAHLASDRVLGRADAPVTIIEYASFTCSHCANFATTVLPEIKSRYIDTGKAKLIFRDLPTAPLQVSNIAAAIGRCAAPERFFDVANHFMTTQSTAFSTGAIQNWFYKSIEASGRTEAEIEACVRLPATGEALNEDISSTIAAGINSTPTLFVNGRRVEDVSLDGMIAAIQPLVR